MACYSPLNGFKSKETGGIVFKRSHDAGEDMQVGCGQCLGCRIDYSQTWAMRIMHEAAMYDQNCFITLTYDDEHLPPDGSLRKSDFQKFMKRLRKRMRGKKIRYYHCGEYGDQLQRPHYHACLFNFSFPDSKLLNENKGHALMTSKLLQELWGKGFTTIGQLTFESAAYVSRYILKKINGHKADDHYMRCDEYGVAYWLQPEYTTMSRGYTCAKHRGIPYQADCPKCSRGIGREWYEKYTTDLWPSDEVPVPGRGVFKKVPRYYEELLADSDPKLHAQIKAKRLSYRKENEEEYTYKRLETKYKVKKAQLQLLKRELEG